MYQVKTPSALLLILALAYPYSWPPVRRRFLHVKLTLELLILNINFLPGAIPTLTRGLASMAPNYGQRSIGQPCLRVIQLFVGPNYIDFLTIEYKKSRPLLQISQWAVSQSWTMSLRHYISMSRLYSSNLSNSTAQTLGTLWRQYSLKRRRCYLPYHSSISACELTPQENSQQSANLAESL